MSESKTLSMLSLLTATLLAPAVVAQCGSSKTSSCTPSSTTVASTHGNAGLMAPKPTIVGVAAAAGQFETLITAVKAAGLAETLSGDGPFTVFAPTDAAFAQIPADKLAELLLPENRATLTRILTYHVVSGRVLASDALAAGKARTLAGETLSIVSTKRGAFVGNAKITATDVLASNGVIHIIDTVLLPPAKREPAVAASSAGKNIVQTAEAAGFTTLLAAAKAAGLADALQGKGPLTVFAPTDEAFAKLPAGTLKSLLDPANKSKLAAILEYHVVAGRIPAQSALSAGTATTLQGSPVAIALRDGRVTIGGARLIKQDIEATNGIIHVIDSVLLPPASKTSRAASTGLTFPQVSGENLEGRTFNLPGALAGDVNLVLVAFKRHQQADIDTWFPAARKLSASYPSMAYYEIPTLGEGWKLMRGFIDGGMASGIQDRAQRERTITLYIDKTPYKRALGITSENDIYAMVVERDGTVLWKTGGRYTEADGVALEQLLSSRAASTGARDADWVQNTSASKAGHARQMIEKAIEHGAPLYNRGDAASCATLYQQTARRLVAMSEELPGCTSRLQMALRGSERSGDHDENAWALRRAMDDLYAQMPQH